MKIRQNTYRNLFSLLGFLLTACTNSPSVLAASGPDANNVASLTWLMFAIAGVVLVIISVLLWKAYQRSLDDESDKDLYADDQSSLRNVVISGGVVPVVILLIVMGLGIRIENSVNRSTAVKDEGSLDIEFIGHQWWWEVRYSNQNFDTANEIHIPVGQKVTVHLTSADVIHSFWVPELHGKIDLIPGQTNTITLEADQVGVYRGQCAEFCGAQHAHMAFLVIAEAVGRL